MTVIAEEWSCTVKEWSLTVTVALVTMRHLKVRVHMLVSAL